MNNIQKAADSVCGMTLQFKEDETGEVILDLSALLERVAVVATELEREECAKLCEGISNGAQVWFEGNEDRMDYDRMMGARECAKAIRGRR